MRRGVLVLAIAAVGVAAGLFSLSVARASPVHSFAGASAAGAAALLAGGWGLIACGLAVARTRPESRFGPLLAAAGFAWFVPELNNPGAPALAFTVGLALSALCPALIGHAVLAYPSGSLASRSARAAVALAYVGAVLVLGVLPALVSDPGAHECSQCPSNLALIVDRPSAAAGLTEVGVHLGVVWALALSALAIRRLVRASPSSRPLFAAGAVYLSLTAVTLAVSLDRGFVAAGALERRLWFAAATALVAVAVAVGWGWIRARRARSAVARLVVDLSQSPPPGGLRDVLAGMIRDPELVLAYPLGDSSRLVDASGREVELSSHQQRTPLIRDGRAVAVLGHAPGLLDDEQLVDEVTGAARLALENERLQAEVRARLEALRASRARIVETGDAERERLEHDLHDGAQQRLVTLALSLRLLRAQYPAVESLDKAGEELGLAISELRELAHGIFPTVLADEGLAAALKALAEEGTVPIRVGAVPHERFAAPVESAAYTVVAEAARSATGALAVRAEQVDGVLAIDVKTSSFDELDVVGLRDRIGALDGRLEFADDGLVKIHAELPCGS
jgi:signal transduction histidine kinase